MAEICKNGQGVGICTRTVSVTVRDAAGYTTALLMVRADSRPLLRVLKWRSHVDLHHEPSPSHGEMQNSYTLRA